MSSCGSVTNGVAKELTKILKLLVGKSLQHINSTHDFVEQVKQFTLAHRECLSSCDISALFTLLLVDPALGVIKDLLEKDTTLKDRTVLPVKDIILLLEFFLKYMYFSFQDQFYEQVKGVAMGSPVSPIELTYTWGTLSKKVSVMPPHPRYVNVIQKEIHKQDFIQHINSVDPAIRFTVKNNKEDGAIAFLDTIVKPEADGNLSITVYRKPTHTDQYLQWDSHHHLSAKFSVIDTLTHRAQTVCSNPELLCKEKTHLRKALTQCKYPRWAFDKVEKRLNKPSREVTDGANSQGTTGAHTLPMKLEPRFILLYLTHKVSESIRKICGEVWHTDPLQS